MPCLPLSFRQPGMVASIARSSGMCTKEMQMLRDEVSELYCIAERAPEAIGLVGPYGRVLLRGTIEEKCSATVPAQPIGMSYQSKSATATPIDREC